MGSKITFGKWEASCLMLSLMGTKTILSTPNELSQIAGSAGWILAIYNTILTLLGFLVIQKLYNRFEGKNLLDISEVAAGKAGRIVVGLILTLFFLFLDASILRSFSEEIKVISFPLTPISVVMLIFMAGVLTAAYMGIESIVRFQGIFVLISILGFLSYLVMLLPHFQIDNITPYLGTGPYKIFIAGFPKMSNYSELVVLFLIYPFIKTKKNFKWVGIVSISASGFFLASLTLMYLGIFSYPVATEYYLPAFQMGRLVSYGRFFQRVEPLFLTTWAIMGFMYLSSLFYLMLYTFKTTFKLEYEKPLIFAFGVLVFNLCLLPPSLVSSKNLIRDYFRNYSGIVTFGMTILILLIAMGRNSLKKKNKKA